MASTSGCVPGTTVTVTNAKWTCNRPLSSYGTLPIKVVVKYTRTTSENGAVDLVGGCVGDSNASSIDLILDVQGDGRTVGNTVDAVKLRLNPRNIQITGRANCGPRTPGAHADGIQNQGSTNITFADFQIGNYDAGLATCQGAGGIAFWTGSPQMHFVRGKFVGCNHALNATQASTASSTYRLDVALGTDGRQRPGLHRPLRLPALHRTEQHRQQRRRLRAVAQRPLADPGLTE